MPETISISDYLSKDTTHEGLEVPDDLQALEELVDIDDSYKHELLSRICEDEDEDKIVIKIIGILLHQKWQETTQQPWPTDPKFPEPVTDACIEFCDSHNLNTVMTKCLTKAREIFSNIEKLYSELSYFRDDEFEDSSHAVIRVEVDSNQKTVINEYDEWADWMVENISPQNSKYITITVKRI